MRLLVLALTFTPACAGSWADSPPPDPGTSDAGTTPPTENCTSTCLDPGSYCDGDECVADCRPATALPCPTSTLCDSVSGGCVPPGAECSVTGEDEACGNLRCGAGTRCRDGLCVADRPCAQVGCYGERCWGVDCPCDRPPVSCFPAPLEELNLAAFSSGVYDLEFDDQCNAWGVTTINGADHLREMTPAGEIRSWTGVSNLNMSETAILRLVDPEFGEDRGAVALTYTCCAECGCATTPPQGVALLDGDSLPMVISATPTSGTGPFGSIAFDTGPQGLVWGKNRVLYVGNVHANGDWARADLEAGTVETVATLPGRVFASYNFDEDSLLVAVAGGGVYLVGTDGGTPVLWTTFPSPITSLARDFFTGRVYVATADLVIHEVDADGTVRGQFATTTKKGRLAISPDGALYHLGFGATPRVTRMELPSRR